MNDPTPADLFTWLRAITAARDIYDGTVRALVLVGLSCTGTTGANVTIDAPAIATALNTSERTVWRRLRPLVGRWLVQTVKPTRGSGGEAGRRARYRLVIPDAGLCNALHSSSSVPESCDSAERGDDTRSDGIVCHPEQNRVTKTVESCDTTERGRGTVLPFVSPTFVSPTRARASDDEETVARVAEALAREAKRDIDKRWAAKVVEHVIGDRADVVRPVEYVVTAVRKNPERYLPTPSPPGIRDVFAAMYPDTGRPL